MTSLLFPQALPQLPSRVRSSLGEEVDLTGSAWHLRRRRHGTEAVAFNVALLDHPRVARAAGRRARRNRLTEHEDGVPRRASTFRPDFTHALRRWLVALIAKRAPTYAQSALHSCIHFEQYLHLHCAAEFAERAFGPEHLRWDVVDAYRRHCEASAMGHGVHARELRRFYTWAVREGVPGCDRATLGRLRSIKFRSRVAGHIVRFHDPRRGSLTWAEQVQCRRALELGEAALPQGVMQAIKGAGQRRAKRQLRMARDRAVVWLLFRLGVRTEALVLLQRRHLRRAPGGEGYVLDVPRVKQVGGAAPHDTIARAIPAPLGALIESLQLAEEKDGGDADLPLLPWLGQRAPRAVVARAVRRWADEYDLTTTRVPPDQGGWRSARLAHNRTPASARLHLFPYRFRRTMATSLAEHGASVEEVAAALDDNTLAMAAVYAEAASYVADLLGETLDQHSEWVYTLSLFRGAVESPAEARLPAVLGGAPYLADFAEFMDIGVIGGCALDGVCTKEPPVSCYQCAQFRPVGDPQPHERQLVQIRRDVDRGQGRESDRVAAVLRRDAAAIVQLLARLTTDRGGVAAVLDRVKASRVRPGSATP